MINIVFCDDSSQMLEIIHHNVKEFLKSEKNYFKIFKTTEPQDVIKLIKNKKINILLLDIDMPGINGFEVARNVMTYSKDTLIIFITNLDTYVYESLKYNPFRFIRKSNLHELEEAINSAVKVIKDSEDRLKISLNTELCLEIKTTDIIYFESEHNNINMVTLEGQKTFRGTLKSIEKEVGDKGFVRIHSGIIINLKYVYLIEKYEVELLYNNERKTLPVSRNRKSQLMNTYKASLR